MDNVVFSQERVYVLDNSFSETKHSYCLSGYSYGQNSKNEVLKNLKHNNELAAAGTDQQILKKVAKGTVQRTDACLQEGQGHFQHLM